MKANANHPSHLGRDGPPKSSHQLLLLGTDREGAEVPLDAPPEGHEFLGIEAAVEVAQVREGTRGGKGEFVSGKSHQSRRSLTIHSTSQSIDIFPRISAAAQSIGIP